MASVETTDDTLAGLISGFEDWLNVTQASREEAELSRDYYDGKQWTDEEIATLNSRKQPVITDNVLKDKIEYVIGLELATRTDPKAFPRNPSDEEAAEAATDALRYIGDIADFPHVKSDVAENMFVEGFGGVEVYVRGEEVIIKRNRWERCYFDPHSTEKDFSDATYRGTFVWMDAEDAEAKWDSADFWDVISADIRGGQDSDSDRPRENFIDRARKRVRIIETYWRKRGQWMRAVWTYAGFLEAPAPSPWQNEDGEPEHPYCWVSAYVDRENNRYGVVRRYKSLQDEINHRRSKALHLLNTNRIVVEDGALEDIERTRREAAKPDGVITRRQGFEFEILTNSELAAGQTALLAEARQALAVTGPKASTNTSAQSGRAKELDRQSDVLELGRLLDQLRHFQKAVYRKAWNRVRQFWTAEKWVRVTDDESRIKFVALNQPITAGQVMQEAMQSGQPVDPRLQFMHPNQVVQIKNQTAQLEVDIIIDEAPDVVTLQQEQFANLVDLARAGVVFPPEVYIEASAIRNKKAITEKIKGADSPEAQAEQQTKAQLAQRGAEAQVAELEAKAAKTQAEAEQTKIENAAGIAGLAGMATTGPPLMQ